MPNRIEFDGDLTADGHMLQWKGRNVGGETLHAGSTHDYLILFDSESQLVVEEKVTRQGDLGPDATYDSFSYVQLPAGDYTGFLTLDQDGDVDTVGERQKELRLQVLDDRVIPY